MLKFTCVLGITWASPLSLLALLYVGTFSAVGWYRWLGIRGNAWVWETSHHVPLWLGKLWRHRAGHSLGNVVVINADVSTYLGHVTLLHEQDKVRQAMLMGPLQPLCHVLIYGMMQWVCRRSDVRYSHPFEVEARRAAGQIVDVEGTLQRLKERTKSKHQRPELTP